MTHIYHERQDAQLCGEHCLNNLVQEPFFTSVQLGNIAQDLDLMERRVLTQSNNNDPRNSSSPSFSFTSSNVDETGNFSFQVLNAAMDRYFHVELISWTGEEGSLVQDPSLEKAFVINHSHHWYTIRKINNQWWNLDSLLKKPTMISPFYLSAYIGQLRDEGSSIFLVRGNIPPCKEKPYDCHSFPPNVSWFSEKSLLEPSTSSLEPVPLEKTPFSGTGKKLGTGQSDFEVSDFKVEDDDDEDTLLAKALSASIISNEIKKPLTTSEIRAKRLEAFQKKSFR